MTTKYFTAEPEVNINASPPSANTSLTLAYRTYGSPDQPAVLMPTCYNGTLDGTLTFLWTPGDDGQPPVLASYFVILCGLLGGSESSSPSNAPPSMRGAAFPETTYEDNVRRQYALCRALGVQQLAAYIGFSMGGQQAYHMAALYPDFVARAVVLASSARTSWHNWSFLEGPKAALVASVDWQGGEYREPVVVGTRAFARVYSTWALSPAWFRGRCWRERGFESVEAYLEGMWSGSGKDAWDLLCMLRTWQRGDIGVAVYGKGKGDGDRGKEEEGKEKEEDEEEDRLPAALAGIKAKVLVMPSRTDCYFPPEDSEEEVRHLRRGELSVIESVWGHLAGGGGGTAEDNAFIIGEVRRWLAE